MEELDKLVAELEEPVSENDLEMEIFDLFANYGSGDYEPTEQEKEVLHSGVAAVIKRAIATGKLREALLLQQQQSLGNSTSTVPLNSRVLKPGNR